ncbi:MAG: hypothetical protein NT062_37940, partial [Proteobacteria bacterium]|nr:hypothetical protein [Pseudomonadota bacterium]
MTERKKSRTPVRPIPAAVPPEPRKSKPIDAVVEPIEPPSPHEPTAPPPATGSPENAAFEAARIVSEIIDIETPTGAVIAAAAAAGAAMEVKRSNERHDGSTADPTEPVTTVRLSRDRILAAIAEDSAAAAAPTSHPPTRKSTEPPATTRVATEPPLAPAASDPPPAPTTTSPTEPGEPE